MTGTRLEGRSFDILGDARRATSRLLDAAPREDRFGHAAGIPAGSGPARRVGADGGDRRVIERRAVQSRGTP